MSLDRINILGVKGCSLSKKIALDLFLGCGGAVHRHRNLKVVGLKGWPMEVASTTVEEVEGRAVWQGVRGSAIICGQ